MSENSDFEVVPSTRGRQKPIEVSDKPYTRQSGKDALLGAAAENMDRLIDLADKALSIKQIQAVSDARIAEYDAQRENIRAEAEVYVAKLRAETEKIGVKMDKLTVMLSDFWHTNRSGEELSAVLPTILEWIDGK